MNNSPKVSIVIPCYNRKQYLGFAIQSVLAQTYTDFELIIVDDGSTDGSVQIAQNYAAQDSRIRILTNPENRGASYVLRDGYEAARGEYVCQVDSDDILECPALERTVAILDTDKDCGLVYTNYLNIDQDGKKTSVGWRCSHLYSKWKILTTFMVFHFRLMRKSVYEQVGGFNPGFDKLEDYDLCLRLSEITQILKVEEFLYLKRNLKDSVSNACRLEVILLTKQAIEAALVRRGLEGFYKVEITYNPQYSLLPISHQ